MKKNNSEGVKLSMFNLFINVLFSILTYAYYIFVYYPSHDMVIGEVLMSAKRAASGALVYIDVFEHHTASFIDFLGIILKFSQGINGIFIILSIGILLLSLMVFHLLDKLVQPNLVEKIGIFIFYVFLFSREVMGSCSAEFFMTILIPLFIYCLFRKWHFSKIFVISVGILASLLFMIKHNIGSFVLIYLTLSFVVYAIYTKKYAVLFLNFVIFLAFFSIPIGIYALKYIGHIQECLYWMFTYNTTFVAKYAHQSPGILAQVWLYLLSFIFAIYYFRKSEYGQQITNICFFGIFLLSANYPRTGPEHLMPASIVFFIVFSFFVKYRKDIWRSISENIRVVNPLIKVILVGLSIYALMLSTVFTFNLVKSVGAAMFFKQSTEYQICFNGDRIPSGEYVYIYPSDSGMYFQLPYNTIKYIYPQWPWCFSPWFQQEIIKELQSKKIPYVIEEQNLKDDEGRSKIIENFICDHYVLYDTLSLKIQRHRSPISNFIQRHSSFISEFINKHSEFPNQEIRIYNVMKLKPNS